MGVSRSLPDRYALFAVPPLLPLLLVLEGGGGRANGLGGPAAPAERSALAEGDGGGRTTPDSPGPRTGVRRAEAAAAVDSWLGSFGEAAVDAVARSLSECSEGISTRRRGRLRSVWRLLVRLGTEVTELVRGGGAVALVTGGCAGADVNCASLWTEPASTVAGRGLGSGLDGSPQCWARRERLSSMGVKILFRADDGRGLGCGIGGLWKVCSGCGDRCGGGCRCCDDGWGGFWSGSETVGGMDCRR